MSWLRIDDGFEEHPKVATLSDAAHRLWFRANCWCHQRANQNTNGFVPERKVVEFCGSKAKAKRLAKELVEARGEIQFGYEKGLWVEEPGGWRFNDWDKYRPGQSRTDSEQEELSKKRSKAGKRGAKSRWNSKQTDGKHDGKLAMLEDGKTDSKPSGKVDGNPDPVPVPVTKKDPPIPPGRGATALLDLAGRSRMFLQSKGDAQSIGAQFGEPPTWPEFVATLKAFELRTGARQEIRSSGDSRVSAILQWFSAGFAVRDLEEVFDLAQRDEFWKTKPLAQLLSRTNRLDDLRQSQSAVKAPVTKNQIVLSEREANMYT